MSALKVLEDLGFEASTDAIGRVVLRRMNADDQDQVKLSVSDDTVELLSSSPKLKRGPALLSIDELDMIVKYAKELKNA